jgi:S-DNA-T family DNA segregation ATPase FtsK/SpoIIIE
MVLSVYEYKRRVDYVLNLCLKHPIEARKWRCVDVKKTRYMIQLTYEIPARYSALDVQKQIDALVATCGADVEIVNYAGRVGIRIYPVDLPDVIPFQPDKIKYDESLFIGINRLREHVRFHFENPHMIVAGETGFGKTVLIYLILYQLVRRNPNDVEIALIDMKGTSFIPFRNLPHFLPICRSLDDAYTLLQDTYRLMNERSNDTWDKGYMPRYKKRFVIIDEAAQLSPSSIRHPVHRKTAQEIDALLSSLASVGRELGINIIYATQYPHSDIVNPSIRFNCGARVCFHVQKVKFSEVVLDESGAEQITQKGRAIFKATGRKELIQVPFADRKQWEEWLNDARRTMRNDITRPQNNAGHEHRTDSAFLSLRPLSIKKGE